MVKRILLAVSFVVALGVAGLTTSAASAYGCGHGGYRAAYYPTYGSYYDYYPTVSYYRAPAYPVYYRGFDGHRHLHHRHSGVTFTFGF